MSHTLAAEAELALAMALRRGSTVAREILDMMESDGWVLMHVPTLDQAVGAIHHQPWHPDVRSRESHDAEAVLEWILHQCT